MSSIADAANERMLDNAIASAIKKFSLSGYCLSVLFDHRGWAVTPLITNWPSAGLKVYETERFYENDPAMKAIMSGAETYLWSIDDIFLNPETRRFFEFLSSTPVRSGVVVAFTLEPFGLCVFSASSESSDRPSQSIAKYIRMIGKMALYKALAIKHAPLQSGSSQSHEQLDELQLTILRWASAGKTNREIGDIIGITERKVVYNFTSIFKKMGVSTRAQAVGRLRA